MRRRAIIGKCLLSITTLFMLSLSGYGQTFSEWFKQKKTQKKYLINQIVALEAYTKVAKKGYDVVSGGLQTYHRIKDGDFRIHEFFFGSLKKVNPAIAHMGAVTEIERMQVAALKDYRDVSAVLDRQYLSDDEIRYVRHVFDQALDDLAKMTDDVALLVSDGSLEMGDDERFARIKDVFIEVRDICTFIRSFANDTRLLLLYRQRGEADVKRLKLLYGLKGR